MVYNIEDDFTIISAIRHISIEEIDGGDIVVVTLECASSEVVFLLEPCPSGLGRLEGRDVEG